MTTEGDRARAIVAMALVRASRDAAFRKKLVSAPAATLKSEGLAPEKGVKWKVLIDTKTVKHVALGRDLRIDPEHDARLAALLARVVPIPEGAELRIVQSTGRTRYLVVPLLPKELKPGELTDDELLAVTGGWHVHVGKDIAVEVKVVVAQTVVEAEAAATSAYQAGEAVEAVVAVAAAVLT
jgi:hypothetical protein